MSTTNDPVRVALIGYGYAGKTFHAPLIQSVPGLELTVVSSRHPEAVQKDWPGVTVVADPAEAAAAEGVDLVVVASPNETHFPLARAALLAGKHVVVDKPFTVTLDEARALQATAREQERILSVFHNRRWDGDFLAARELIASGKLGEVAHYESHIDRFRPEVRVRWREQAVPGGGLWYDLGPHLIDQALVLFGLPETVSAHLAQQREDAQTEDWAHVLLDYGRRKVVLHASMLVAHSGPRFTVHGTRGTWVKMEMDVQEGQLIKGLRPGAPDWGVAPEPSLFFDGTNSQPEKIPLPPGDYPQYYARIHAAIREGEPNPVPPAQAIAVMAVLQTALESAKAGQVLELSLSEEDRRAYERSLS
jgi:predicted dehydrogenase